MPERLPKPLRTRAAVERTKPTLAEAFEDRTLRTTDCWYWIGNINPITGYGRLTRSRVNILAHRVAYELAKGPIPPDLVIDHLCRNVQCVNPGHLQAVTHRENTLRGLGATARNARATHCTNGHEKSAANIYVSPRGKRDCRICRTLRKQSEREA